MSKHPAHNLVPDEVAKRLPALGEGKPDPVVQVKWFGPDSGWTWYVTEYDPVNRIGYGLVHGAEKEFGTFALSEIEAFRGVLGLRVERDLHFTPRPVSEFLK